MYTYQLRRDYAVRWTRVNPILMQGEPGFEIDTGRLKIGDGYATWLELGYFTPGLPLDSGDISDEVLLAHINSTHPHPVYDDGPSLFLLYENAKV